jgi:branched-chain amino acid transport system permease protein
MGIDTARTKAVTFGVSAAYTGIAGALGTFAAGFVSPDSFDAFLSIRLLVGIVVGGLGSISGAFFGAAFIEFVPNLAERISKAAPWAIYGVLLILVMYVMPGGVVGLMRATLLRLDIARRLSGIGRPIGEDR